MGEKVQGMYGVRLEVRHREGCEQSTGTMKACS